MADSDITTTLAKVLSEHRFERHSVSEPGYLSWWGHCTGCGFESQRRDRNYVGWELDMRDDEAAHAAKAVAAVLRERYDIFEKGQLRQEWGVQDGADSPPYFSHPTREGAENHRQTILGNYVGAPKKPLKPPPNPSIVSRLVSSWRVVDGQETP